MSVNSNTHYLTLYITAGNYYMNFYITLHEFCVWFICIWHPPIGTLRQIQLVPSSAPQISIHPFKIFLPPAKHIAIKREF